MNKKLYISLFFSNLVKLNPLSSNHRMYNFIQNSSKYLRYASNSQKISSMNLATFHVVVQFQSFRIWKWWHYP